jgi:hypothetical protein
LKEKLLIYTDSWWKRQYSKGRRAPGKLHYDLPVTLKSGKKGKQAGPQ